MSNSPLSIDPALFAEEAITEETARAVAAVEAFLKTIPPIYEIGAVIVRESRKNGEGLLGMQPLSDIAEWRTINANGLEVPIRVFTPETINGVYLHIHGGGHTIGSADSHDQMLEKLAKETNQAVVSVEYRLAPEHPWPAGPDDCEAAACWLADKMKSEFGTQVLTTGGESAGAHLAAVTMLRMRDKHGFTGYHGANLVYGVFDLSMTPSLRNWGERNLVLNRKICEWFGDNLLPPDQYSLEAKRDPEISPLYAKLHDLPPALFTVGTLDPIIDDTLFMAQHWLRSGLETQLEIYPGGIHAFDAMPIPIARQAHARINEFLTEQVEKAQ